MRELTRSPLFLALFAWLSLLVGALQESRAVVLVAGAGALATSGWWLRRAWQRRRAGGWVGAGEAFPPPPPPLARRWGRRLATLGLALVAAYAEWVALELALHPWAPPPPGPVRGDVAVHGVDYGKGELWSPTVCRPATNPGVAAVALMARDEPFPVAWVIGRPDGAIGAIDVQRYDGGPTTRFLPAECVRVHGRVGPAGGRGGLAGYADAECDHAGDHLALHVDFAACEPPPAPALPKGR